MSPPPRHMPINTQRRRVCSNDRPIPTNAVTSLSSDKDKCKTFK